MKKILLNEMDKDDLRMIIREEFQHLKESNKEKILIPKTLACKRLGKTPQTLDAWHRAGILLKRYIGGRVFYNEEDIKRLKS